MSYKGSGVKKRVRAGSTRLDNAKELAGRFLDLLKRFWVAVKCIKLSNGRFLDEKQCLGSY